MSSDSIAHSPERPRQHVYYDRGTLPEVDAKTQFLSRFDPDPLTAERQYKALRAKLVFYFQQNGCADPENLADDVFLRVLRRLSEGVELYVGMNAFCYGVADYVLREERRRPRGEEFPDELPPKDVRSPGSLKPAEQVILIRECLEHLNASDRDLFTRYHLEDREALARDLNITSNALRVQICRIRQKLQDKLAAKPEESALGLKLDRR